MEAGVGIEPTHEGIAGPGLPTWLPRREIIAPSAALPAEILTAGSGKNVKFEQRTKPLNNRVVYRPVLFFENPGRTDYD